MVGCEQIRPEHTNRVIRAIRDQNAKTLDDVGKMAQFNEHYVMMIIREEIIPRHRDDDWWMEFAQSCGSHFLSGA